MNGLNSFEAPTVSTRKSWSILIVEDHALFGEGLKLGLFQTAMFHQIRHVLSGKEAVETIPKYPPDLILMDIIMPEMDGLMATQAIKQRYPGIKIIMLTSLNDQETIRKALSAGADGYVSKEVSMKRLAEVIVAVMNGSLWLDPAIAREVLFSISKTSGKQAVVDIPTPDTNNSQNVLTPRDIQILTLIADNKSNDEIALSLGISNAWIQGYVRNIIDKLAVGNEIQAVKKAMDDGVLRYAKILNMDAQ